MTFREAQLKLLAYVVDRIHNGELTERGFARLLGISQPHVHNVLKGVRNLSPEIFDSILKYFNLSLLDLASVEELEANFKKRKAPTPAADRFPRFAGNWTRYALAWGGSTGAEAYPLPLPALAIAGRPDHGGTSQRSIYVRDAGRFGHWSSRYLGTGTFSNISPVRALRGQPRWEAVLRHIRPAAQGLYLVTDATLDTPALWEKVGISYGELAAIVKARVFWIGRERDRYLSMRQRGRLL